MALNLKPRPKSTTADDDTESSSAFAPVTKRPANRPAPTAGNKSAFVRASTPISRRLICSFSGEEKSGKNHLAFTAPEPLYVHSFDIGLEGVIEKFQDDKEIYTAEYELTIQPGDADARAVAEAADAVWSKFVDNYKDSIASTRKHGTVIVDTGTETWELLRLARFGKLTQIMPHHYGPVNAEMRNLVREAYDGSNAIFLQKLVDQYENYTDSQGKEKGRKTGIKEPKQFKDMPFLVQLIGQCNRDGSDFSVEVQDCRQNAMANGVIIPNDFSTLLDLVFG